MPLQNRVTPWGAIEVSSARGSMMGIRGGCFHDGHKQLRARHWAGRGWLCCLLRFKGRRRQVMTPGRYTELFFLDEATALVSGHRPCFECRRADARDFAGLWAAVHEGGRPVKAPDMDLRLHAERTAIADRQTVDAAALDRLPPGAFVQSGSLARLLLGDGRSLAWSHAGYRDDGARLSGPLTVLTPPATLAILSAGYRPMLHATAFQHLPPDHPFRLVPPT